MAKPKNILQHIEDVHLNVNYPAKTHRMSYTFGLEAGSDQMTADEIAIEYDYVGRLQIWYSQRVRRRSDPNEAKHQRERAQRAIAHHLYGDIVHDLRALYDDLFTYGMNDDEGLKIKQRVGDMIDTLSGAMSRFER